MVVLIAIASVALLSTPDAPVSLKRSTAPTATPTVKLQQKLDETLAKRKQSEEQVVEGTICGEEGLVVAAKRVHQRLTQ